VLPDFERLLMLRHDRFVILIVSLVVTGSSLVTEADVYKMDKSFGELSLAESVDRFEAARYTLESVFGYMCDVDIDQQSRFGDRPKRVMLRVEKPTEVSVEDVWEPLEPL